MELPIHYQESINLEHAFKLMSIKTAYDDKKILLQEFLEDIEKNKHKPDFNVNEHYKNFYLSQFASIGGRISGHVRHFKNYLIMDLLNFMRTEFKEKMDLFTLKMYQRYSKEVFNSSPTQQDLIPFLNKDISLDQKLKDKKETFKHSHVSKMSWLNILGDGVNEEMRSIFNKYYDAFIYERKLLKEVCVNEENAVKLILRSSKKNNKTEKEE
ncbi:hypothetical protein I6Z00_004247 [Vibrio parahaemolyticus]|nr:hypothetical protein [Vibrio parahaemolyticus]